MPDDGNDFEKTLIINPTVKQQPPAAILSCVGPAPTGSSSQVSLVDSELTFGRSDEHDVVLAVDGISRNHARVYPGNGIWGLQDLGSTNGVFVNKTKVERAWLEPGDIVSIGTVHYKYGLAETALGASPTPDIDISDAEKTLVIRPEAKSVSMPAPANESVSGPGTDGLAQRAAPRTTPTGGGSFSKLWAVVAAVAVALVVGVIVLFTQ